MLGLLAILRPLSMDHGKKLSYKKSDITLVSTPFFPPNHLEGGKNPEAMAYFVCLTHATGQATTPPLYLFLMALKTPN